MIKQILLFFFFLFLIFSHNAPNIDAAYPTSYQAILNSTGEVPANPSTATGQSALVIQPDGSALVNLSFSNLTTAQTSAHIQGPAGPQNKGPILFTFPIGQVTNFSLTFSSYRRELLRAGFLYANVHSQRYTDGEIRGAYLPVAVNQPSQGCVRAKPTFNLSNSSQSGVPGQGLTYNFVLKNNDSISCGISEFSIIPDNGDAGALFTMTPQVYNRILAPGEQIQDSIVLTSRSSVFDYSYHLHRVYLAAIHAELEGASPFIYKEALYTLIRGTTTPIPTNTPLPTIPTPTTAPIQTGYLSDQSWTSMTNGDGPVLKDKANNGIAGGGTITLNSQTFAKGLGAHANSDIRYNLAGQCSTFAAKVGVDDSGGGNNGSVVFQVFTDGTKLFDSGTMTGPSTTQTINVSLSDKQTLQLVVTNAGDNWNFDRADWADAYVTCGSTLPGNIVPPDNIVDILDYNAVVTDFGFTGANLKSDISLPLGSVDIFDYNKVISNFGRTQ